MKSDSLFYRLFQESPGSYFELIGEPAAMAAHYKFTAEELKHTGVRLDGLFVPARAGMPVHFLEVYHYKFLQAYSNLFTKVFLWLNAHDPAQDWHACVMFADRSLEPPVLKPYRELLEGGRVSRIYLNELPEPGEDQVGQGILQVIACPPEQAVAKAKVWLERVRTVKKPVGNRGALVELIEAVC